MILAFFPAFNYPVWVYKSHPSLYSINVPLCDYYRYAARLCVLVFVIVFSPGHFVTIMPARSCHFYASAHGRGERGPEAAEESQGETGGTYARAEVPERDAAEGDGGGATGNEESACCQCSAAIKACSGQGGFSGCRSWV